MPADSVKPVTRPPAVARTFRFPFLSVRARIASHRGGDERDAVHVKRDKVDNE
jgi:hypothetical protein